MSGVHRWRIRGATVCGVFKSMLARADEFVMQPRIDASRGEQSFMRAALDDFALIEHEDEVGFADGA